MDQIRNIKTEILSDSLCEIDFINEELIIKEECGYKLKGYDQNVNDDLTTRPLTRSRRSTKKTPEHTSGDENSYTFINYAKQVNNEPVQIQKPEAIGLNFFQCTYCDKTFRRKDNLKTHERLHTGEKPYSCSFCDKTFRIYVGWKYHERTHTGEKPFKCNYCKKPFSQPGSVKEHENIHTGARPYICSYCYATFKQRVGLFVHLKKHTGEKPFQCEFCKKTFSISATWKAHVRSHTGEKFKCNHCEKEYTTSSSLKCHQRLKHKQLLSKMQKSKGV